MADILYISKAVEPPWNDSSKNLVRDLSRSLTRHHGLVMTHRPVQGDAGEFAGTTPVAIYGATRSSFAPGMGTQGRVLAYLLASRRPGLWHFFFAPNPRSSMVGSLTSRLRRMPTVHTVCSAPRADADMNRVLFADRTVVLSRHTEARLLEAGVERARLERIPPAIAPLSLPQADHPAAAQREQRVHFDLPADVPVVVYPGDLEFGIGARVAIDALRALSRQDVHLVLACRAKTASANAAAAELMAYVEANGLARRVHFVGETPRIHGLLLAADLVVLPTETLYAKMDYPLVLLEAMCLERPVIVGANTPAAELAEGGAIVAEVTAAAVAAEIQRLLDDGETRSRVGARSRRHVLAAHHPGAMARAYERLYDEVLA